MAGERLDFEIPRAGARIEAFTKRLPKIPGVDVVLDVRKRASEVVEFIRDEGRATRWDRRGDVLHSSGGNPWGDLERLRASSVAEREVGEAELQRRPALPARREVREGREWPGGEHSGVPCEPGRSVIDPSAVGSRRRGTEVER